MHTVTYLLLCELLVEWSCVALRCWLVEKGDLQESWWSGVAVTVRLLVDWC